MVEIQKIAKLVFTENMKRDALKRGEVESIIRLQKQVLVEQLDEIIEKEYAPKVREYVNG